jgi:hypothetical protein
MDANAGREDQTGSLHPHFLANHPTVGIGSMLNPEESIFQQISIFLELGNIEGGQLLRDTSAFS